MTGVTMSKTKYYTTPELKVERLKRDYSQEQMADFLALKLGRELSLSFYQKLEQGVATLSVELALDISAVLKRPVRELVEQK
jgi:transcriptional regulator with XRE-family HTH domain